MKLALKASNDAMTKATKRFKKAMTERETGEEPSKRSNKSKSCVAMFPVDQFLLFIYLSTLKKKRNN